MHGVDFVVSGLRWLRVITGVGVVMGACCGYQDMLGRAVSKRTLHVRDW